MQKATSRKRLTQFEVSDYLEKNNIHHRDTGFFYEASKRKEKGQTDLGASVLSRSNKSPSDLIENT